MTAQDAPQAAPSLPLNQVVRLRQHDMVETEIMVLDRLETFADYHRVYGDQLTDWYEDDRVIVLPHVTLPADTTFLSGVTLPAKFKKTGLVSGIARHLVAGLNPDGSFRLENPLWQSGLETAAVIYLHQQIVAISDYLLQAVPALFPRYRFIEGTGNITYRLCPTRDEEMHVDHYQKSTGIVREHRVKLFINLDSEQRYWRIGDTIFTLIRKLRDRLPGPLPESINGVAGLLNELLADLPAHDLLYPHLSCVIGNGETISHQVLYGNRVIGYEWRTEPDSMRNVDRLAFDRLQVLRRQEAAATQ